MNHWQQPSTSNYNTGTRYAYNNDHLLNTNGQNPIVHDQEQVYKNREKQKYSSINHPNIYGNYFQRIPAVSNHNVLNVQNSHLTNEQQNIYNSYQQASYGNSQGFPSNGGNYQTGSNSVGPINLQLASRNLNIPPNTTDRQITLNGPNNVANHNNTNYYINQLRNDNMPDVFFGNNQTIQPNQIVQNQLNSEEKNFRILNNSHFVPCIVKSDNQSNIQNTNEQINTDRQPLSNPNVEHNLFNVPLPRNNQSSPENTNGVVYYSDFSPVNSEHSHETVENSYTNNIPQFPIIHANQTGQYQHQPPQNYDQQIENNNRTNNQISASAMAEADMKAFLEQNFSSDEKMILLKEKVNYQEFIQNLISAVKLTELPDITEVLSNYPSSDNINRNDQSVTNNNNIYPSDSPQTTEHVHNSPNYYQSVGNQQNQVPHPNINNQNTNIAFPYNTNNYQNFPRAPLLNAAHSDQNDLNSKNYQIIPILDINKSSLEQTIPIYSSNNNINNSHAIINPSTYNNNNYIRPTTSTSTFNIGSNILQISPTLKNNNTFEPTSTNLNKINLLQPNNSANKNNGNNNLFQRAFESENNIDGSVVVEEYTPPQDWSNNNNNQSIQRIRNNTNVYTMGAQSRNPQLPYSQTNFDVVVNSNDPRVQPNFNKVVNTNNNVNGNVSNLNIPRSNVCPININQNSNYSNHVYMPNGGSSNTNNNRNLVGDSLDLNQNPRIHDVTISRELWEFMMSPEIPSIFKRFHEGYAFFNEYNNILIKALIEETNFDFDEDDSPEVKMDNQQVSNVLSMIFTNWHKLSQKLIKHDQNPLIEKQASSQKQFQNEIKRKLSIYHILHGKQEIHFDEGTNLIYLRRQRVMIEGMEHRHMNLNATAKEYIAAHLYGATTADIDIKSFNGGNKPNIKTEDLSLILIGKTIQTTFGRRFQCIATDCSKIYSKTNHLKDHARTHTCERPYVCHHQNCNWAFTRPDELTRHARKHTGYLPYYCCYCMNIFSRCDHLTDHIKKHKDEYKWSFTFMRIVQFFSNLTEKLQFLTKLARIILNKQVMVTLAFIIHQVQTLYWITPLNRMQIAAITHTLIDPSIDKYFIQMGRTQVNVPGECGQPGSKCIDPALEIKTIRQLSLPRKKAEKSPNKNLTIRTPATQRPILNVGKKRSTRRKNINSKRNDNNTNVIHPNNLNSSINVPNPSTVTSNEFGYREIPMLYRIDPQNTNVSNPFGPNNPPQRL